MPLEDDEVIKQSPDGLTWVLTFLDVTFLDVTFLDPPETRANSTVLLSISNLGGEHELATTSVNALSGVAERYSPITAGGDIAEGDRILLAVSAYPAGWTYQLHDFNGVLAQGTLQ